ncbi:MAG TPA: hypothetical protein DEP53_10900 [Bacteroidetes bacterium]|nr:MAG: hypothetical protein A2X66_09375 [Ignavibacteria bacterium GWA2_54_16]HCA80227.1 hypothetical protein [Bacteroidota bacterium]
MKNLLLLICLLVLSVSGAFGQRLQARLVTSAYAWERQDTIGTSSQHLFGYQTVQLSLAGEQLSFHTYLQGFNDFAGPVKNDPTVRLYNLYAKWSNIARIADLSIGRQAVFAGVGTGTIDGGLATMRFLDSKVKVVGYYGSLPSLGYKAALIENAADNSMMGGQLVVAPVEFAQASVSYMKRNMRPETYFGTRRDSLFNPYLVEIKPSATAEEYLSGDLSLDYKEIVSGYARFDYDLLLEKNSRFQLFTRVTPFSSSSVKVLQPLSITAEYLQREPRLLFNSIFSVFSFTSLKEYEAGAEYSIGTKWQVFAKYGSVSYNDATQNQITVGVNGEHISASLTRDDGDGGELSAASLNLGYPLFENKLTPTLLVGYAHYKLSEFSQLENALSVAVGAVYRPLRALSVDAQAQWIQNKIYNTDMRFFVRVNYLFSQQLAIF